MLDCPVLCEALGDGFTFYRLYAMLDPQARTAQCPDIRAELETCLSGAGSQLEPPPPPWIRARCNESLWKASVCPGLRHQAYFRAIATAHLGASRIAPLMYVQELADKLPNTSWPAPHLLLVVSLSA